MKCLIKLHDRKKNIFKLAQGEYTAPEKIENVYTKCRFVSQCFIHGKRKTLLSSLYSHLTGFYFTSAISQPSENVSIIGDSFNSSLVAIVSVDPDVMKDWAASEGIKVFIIF